MVNIIFIIFKYVRKIRYIRTGNKENNPSEKNDEYFEK